MNESSAALKETSGGYMYYLRKASVDGCISISTRSFKVQRYTSHMKIDDPGQTPQSNKDFFQKMAFRRLWLK
jgi:hypothetical protein